MLLLLLEICLAFTFGSIPFGIIVCHYLGLASPQSYGSRNIGATNVARQNKLAGALTLLLDIAKGLLAVAIFKHSALVVLAVVSGHCFSPLLDYRGGKGVATLLGALISLNSALAITFSMIWGLTFFRYQISAIASVVATGVLLLYALISVNIPLIITSLIVILRHSENIESLYRTKTS